MEKLELYIPKLEDLWFYQKMMSDPETMSYNAGWDVDYDGYHRDTGCIDYRTRCCRTGMLIGSDRSRIVFMPTSNAVPTVCGSAT